MRLAFIHDGTTPLQARRMKRLKPLDFARTPLGLVDNIMRVHSLRPSTMNGHIVLYWA